MNTGRAEYLHFQDFSVFLSGSYVSLSESVVYTIGKLLIEVNAAEVGVDKDLILPNLVQYSFKRMSGGEVTNPRKHVTSSHLRVALPVRSGRIVGYDTSSVYLPLVNVFAVRNNKDRKLLNYEGGKFTLEQWTDFGFGFINFPVSHESGKDVFDTMYKQSLMALNTNQQHVAYHLTKEEQPNIEDIRNSLKLADENVERMFSKGDGSATVSTVFDGVCFLFRPDTKEFAFLKTASVGTKLVTELEIDDVVIPFSYPIAYTSILTDGVGNPRKNLLYGLIEVDGKSLLPTSCFAAASCGLSIPTSQAAPFFYSSYPKQEAESYFSFSLDRMSDEPAQLNSEDISKLSYKRVTSSSGYKTPFFSQVLGDREVFKLGVVSAPSNSSTEITSAYSTPKDDDYSHGGGPMPCINVAMAAPFSENSVYAKPVLYSPCEIDRELYGRLNLYSASSKGPLSVRIPDYQFLTIPGLYGTRSKDGVIASHVLQMYPQLLSTLQTHAASYPDTSEKANAEDRVALEKKYLQDFSTVDVVWSLGRHHNGDRELRQTKWFGGSFFTVFCPLTSETPGDKSSIVFREGDVQGAKLMENLSYSGSYGGVRFGLNFLGDSPIHDHTDVQVSTAGSMLPRPMYPYAEQVATQTSNWYNHTVTQVPRIPFSGSLLDVLIAIQRSTFSLCASPHYGQIRISYFGADS